MSLKWKQICAALRAAELKPRAGSQVSLPARQAIPLQNIPSWLQAGPRAGRHLQIISELAPASQAHGWTFQIFPPLSLTFPYSLTPNTLSYSLSPFIPVQKQRIEAKCDSWLPGKVSLQRDRVAVTLQGVWCWEGSLLTAEPRTGGRRGGGVGNSGGYEAPAPPPSALGPGLGPHL